MSHLYSCDLAHCDVRDSIMYYRPSLAANAAFLALFAFSGIAHIAQGTITRKPYFLGAMICGCTAEVIGYIGRLISWNNPFSLNGFLIGICCITLAPAFFAAAIYFTLGDVVRHVSVDSSRIKPKTYAMIFIPCDLVSLILQGTGGGLASTASQNNKNVTNPTHVMVAGLAFQVATMAAFIAICLDYAFRVWKLQKRSGVTIAPHISKQKLAIFTAFFSLAIVTIFIRTVYRVIELAGGWTSKLYRTQTDYIVLEGV
jgi:RTA1 like protein